MIKEHAECQTNNARLLLDPWPFSTATPFIMCSLLAFFTQKSQVGILNYIQDIYSLGLSSLKVLYIVIKHMYIEKQFIRDRSIISFL